jgi:hypothetical protein
MNRTTVCMVMMALACSAGPTWAAEPAGLAEPAVARSDSFFGEPVRPLSLVDNPESVYAPPAPPSPEEGVNAGAVNTDIRISYWTDYIFRGVNRFGPLLGHEDAANVQFDGKLSFDLGKLPHPFIGIFTNVAEADPISNFEEIRPYFGADWTIRPLTFTGGLNTYIFPDRDELQTAEIFGKIQLDDSILLHTERPLLSPYIYAAYDYDKYNGWYFEAGVQHDLVLEDTGLTLTFEAALSYVSGVEFFAGDTGRDTGLQHYRLGLIGTYSLNTLFNVPRRYGEWTLQGYLYYIDGIHNHLRADTQLYGGAGIGFRY